MIQPFAAIRAMSATVERGGTMVEIGVAAVNEEAQQAAKEFVMDLAAEAGGGAC